MVVGAVDQRMEVLRGELDAEVDVGRRARPVANLAEVCPVLEMLATPIGAPSTSSATLTMPSCSPRICRPTLTMPSCTLHVIRDVDRAL